MQPRHKLTVLRLRVVQASPANKRWMGKVHKRDVHDLPTPKPRSQDPCSFRHEAQVLNSMQVTLGSVMQGVRTVLLRPPHFIASGSRGKLGVEEERLPANFDLDSLPSRSCHDEKSAAAERHGVCMDYLQMHSDELQDLPRCPCPEFRDGCYFPAEPPSEGNVGGLANLCERKTDEAQTNFVRPAAGRSTEAELLHACERQRVHSVPGSVCLQPTERASACSRKRLVEAFG